MFSGLEYVFLGVVLIEILVIESLLDILIEMCLESGC